MLIETVLLVAGGAGNLNQTIAGLLAANPPDVAGLQEVSLWETGPIGGPLSPSYDFLELLLAALAGHGLTYRPVAVNVNFASDPTPIRQPCSVSPTKEEPCAPVPSGRSS